MVVPPRYRGHTTSVPWPYHLGTVAVLPRLSLVASISNPRFVLASLSIAVLAVTGLFGFSANLSLYLCVRVYVRAHLCVCVCVCVCERAQILYITL